MSGDLPQTENLSPNLSPLSQELPQVYALKVNELKVPTEDDFSFDQVIEEILLNSSTADDNDNIEQLSDNKSEMSFDYDPELDAIIGSPITFRAINERTLYGGYRVSLATEARNLAEKVRDNSTFKVKGSHVRMWENIFGKHRARCHPMSIVDLIRKEGRSTIFLITLGFIVSILDFIIGIAVLGISIAKGLLKEYIKYSLRNEWQSEYLDSIYNVIFLCCLTVLATTWTWIIDPIAAGSGIPEMKAILSGDLRRELARYLQAKTLLSKTIGLICSLGSGLSIGKEGPFVHTSCIVCHQLMKRIPYFNSLLNNKSLHRHIYSAACAVGVASTFATPIGGLLFSIEVTSTFYLVSTYWRGFAAAISSAIATSFLLLTFQSGENDLQPLFPTNFVSSFSHIEFIPFCLLGVLMGCLGPAYVQLSDRIRQFFYPMNHRHPFIWSGIIGISIGILLYFPGKFGSLNLKEIVQELCNPIGLPKYIWSFPSVFLSLPLFAFSRIFATVLSVALPLPAGDFMPLFIIGGALGRWIGEILLYIFPHSGIVSGGYALVGAASLVGSATHTMSAAVIALEFTGQFTYVLPIFLSVMIACGLSQALSYSIYDCVLMRKGLPYLPLLRFDRLQEVTAKDLMNRKLRYVTLETTYDQIKTLLKESFYTSYPVVETSNGMLFHGCINREDLITVLKEMKKKTINPSPLDGYLVAKNLCEFYSNSNDIFVTPKKDLCNDPSLIHLLSLPGITINRSPLLIDEYTPAEEVHILFEMMRCSMLFVKSSGYLVGVISRRSLYFRLHYINSGNKTALGA